MPRGAHLLRLMAQQRIDNDTMLRSVLREHGQLGDSILRRCRLMRAARRLAKAGEVMRVTRRGSDPVWQLYQPHALSLESSC